ncbi:F-box domain protein [Mycena indigotica]|uniref:F-box domain protein n=1 Tax=Mycena indigotica TaxID=2126181 RepID=A0A8H6SG67_9AGAR|nr:F-box domain protein [Mycena indigotica]KAF7299000.1 F-box domain protein [Mycena indigotica]
MSTWTDHLKRARALVKASKHPKALRELEKALAAGGDRETSVYECRSGIYEGQNKYKSALIDAKAIIQLAPARWQGYARAARLFLQVRKLEEATRMADMALTRLDGKDAAAQREALAQIKSEAERYRRQTMNHFVNLPVELMAIIFELVTLDWPHQQGFILGGVCRHWRNVALGTPRLWSTIMVNKTKDVRRAQRGLERAKGIVDRLVLGPFDQRTTSLKLESVRWDRLRVCSLESNDITPFIGGKSRLGRLSNLEQLDISHTEKSCDHILVVPVSRLKLDSASFTWSVLCAQQNYLTSLEVESPTFIPTVEEIWLLLETNPLLETFAVALNRVHHQTIPELPPLVMSNLHTLRLDRTPWLGYFLYSVTMPSLQSLQFCNTQLMELGLLAQKQPRLQHLCINNIFFPGRELVQLLHSCPALHTLELQCLSEMDPVINALANPRLSLCPALTTLDVSNGGVKTVPLLRLLEARNGEANADVARIRHLKADRCLFIEAKAVPWIRTQVETFSCVYLDRKAASWKR